MSKYTSGGRGKDVGLFEKGQIIGMHQAEKTSKETAETTKIGLRTVQHFIKNWRDIGPIIFEEEMWSEKTLFKNV